MLVYVWVALALILCAALRTQTMLTARIRDVPSLAIASHWALVLYHGRAANRRRSRPPPASQNMLLLAKLRRKLFGYVPFCPTLGTTNLAQLFFSAITTAP